ncbi:30S ribosomal protein S2 [Candidatus Dojkabacteria bacterium]|nr:30S ribosomal protein S2 [Candidatus Dojkabacteria bacterium]
MVESTKEPAAVKQVKLSFDTPEIKDFLKAGVQFGHQTKRWNPKMEQYIFGSKNGVHIIDVIKTDELLKKALLFLVEASSRGPVLFVGTKRQAKEMTEKYAVDSGAYFVTHRWVGGLLTNSKSIKKSLSKLAKLEELFEQGVEGRTKFEISRMKKEWERLDRLYKGIKTMESNPSALVLVDVKYERNAIFEAGNVGVPIVALVDTNTDPEQVNYPIPANDDAVSSIEMFLALFAEAVKQGNAGKGVKHDFKDYTKVDVAIKKQAEIDEEAAAAVVEEVAEVKITENEPRFVKPKRIVRKTKSSGGILEGVQKEKEAKKVAAAEIEVNENKVEKPAVKSAAKSVKPVKPVKSKKLSARIEKALKDNKISVEKAKKMQKAELVELKGIGAKAAEEILNG